MAATSRRRGPVVRLAARLPVDPRAELWAAIRAKGGAPWAVRELVKDTGIGLRTVEAYMSGLSSAGIVAQHESGTGWVLARDVGCRPPRLRRDGSVVDTGRDRQAAWTAMRIQKEFTAFDLHISTGAGLSNVRHYVIMLHKAAYLICVRPGRAQVPARYRLDPRRNTGPLAPVVAKIRVVFDPNLAQIVWPTEAHTAEITAEEGKS